MNYSDIPTSSHKHSERFNELRKITKHLKNGGHRVKRLLAREATFLEEKQNFRRLKNMNNTIIYFLIIITILLFMIIII